MNPESGDPEDELTPDAIEFCRKVGSNATRVSEIAGGKDRAVHTAIQEGINAVNKVATSNAQRIQKWSILDRDFSITGGELGEWSGNTSLLITSFFFLLLLFVFQSFNNATEFSHRPDNEAEAASCGEDVQGADRELLQRGGHSDHPRQPAAFQIKPRFAASSFSPSTPVEMF